MEKVNLVNNKLDTIMIVLFVHFIINITISTSKRAMCLKYMLIALARLSRLEIIDLQVLIFDLIKMTWQE